MKAKYWVVVGNGSKILVYAWDAITEPLREQMCLANPDNRLRDHDIDGASVGQSIAGRAGLAPRHYPKEHQREKFAQQVADALDQGRVKGSYNSLILAVSSPFLGLLSSRLSALTRPRINQSYTVDVTMLPTTELENWLRQRQQAGLPEG
ncbi:MAG: host attachment protein [Burkholderiaceae bacterium]|jgi:hypothetical protein